MNLGPATETCFLVMCEVAIACLPLAIKRDKGKGKRGEECHYL
jgi:hypothetical protein